MSSGNKLILKLAGAILVLCLILFVIFRYNTKAHSPEETITYNRENIKLEVFYNRPYKRDREIFGGLVPYNEVWRTGANEATTFESSKDILVDGSLLKAGKYTLWTIPKEDSWKVIFNSQMYPWGIDTDKKASRDPEFDVLVIERPVITTSESLEQFSIYFEDDGEFINLILAWDKTKVLVPLIPEGSAIK
ncbi:DUF2911 domain-containing protein [Christiangramia salexigens]|uniref:DUF2911 domain-containing protein n=1 Tax=Christiangramia salexigens TaxID=1913577 RepID=A0A1L3J4W8_9FLAO|nr:DUF2911 domain-containing protein [Christiangramia salexigens]APG60143.1 hypothetical protein LPB144_06810 [Christiangramia salexigens]